jgi:hypothetical protein
VVIAVASISWVIGGAVLAHAVGAWWPWLLAACGALFPLGYVVLVPRLRRVREQLAQVAALQREQEHARDAQQQAMQLAFQRPAIRTPYPSSSGA